MLRAGKVRGLGGVRLGFLTALGAGVVCTTAMAELPESETVLQQEERYWKFRVYLDDREIGFHEFRVSGDGRDARVEIDARFDVKFLFVTAYSYRHSNVEVWRDGCLARIESETDDNGETIEVTGNIVQSGFELDGSGVDAFVDSDCVKTFAYWNPAILEADRLLNAQTGEWVAVDIAERGTEALQVGEKPVTARRYRISMEEGAIDLWYHADNGQWLALQAPTESGRILRYEPIGLPRELRADERLAME